jgi:glycerol-3-phosphate cytidylyltransferase
MKIGFQCSSFDLFNAGHVTMLRQEKDLCDYLKVGLQVDPSVDRPSTKNKPVESVYERYVKLQGCKYIDEILVYETEVDLLNLIKTQVIHIRFLSEEYKYRDFTGKDYCIANGIDLYYHKRQHTYSSSNLRQRTYELEIKRVNEKDVPSFNQHSTSLLP